MKRDRPNRIPHSRCPIRPRKGLFTYLILLTSAVFLTQLVRTFVPALLLSFLLILPAVDLLLLGVSLFFVSADLKVRDRVLTRGEPAVFTLVIRNRGPLPLSCAELSFLLPRADAAATEAAAVRVALPPFSESRTEVSILPPGRGLLSVGAKAFFLTDYFHLIRVRKPCGGCFALRILPRLLPFRGPVPEAVKPVPSRVVPAARSASEEYGEIRDYRPGDSLRAIHWKLSSKTEEWQIREKTPEGGRRIRIALDFGDPGRITEIETASAGKALPAAGEAGGAFPSLGLAVANRIAEEALALARRIAEEGIEGCLFWREKNGGEALHSFVAATGTEALSYPLSEADGAALLTVLSDGQKEDAGFVFCLIPFLDASDEARLLKLAGECPGTPFAAVVLSFSSYLPPSERKSYRDALHGLRERLTGAGIAVILPPEEEERS